MQPAAYKPRSKFWAIIFDLLDPLPFAFFVGALIFDIAYASSAEILWMKAAAWLIVMGLISAIIPRLINLARVWMPSVHNRGGKSGKLSFWLHLFGIVAAIVNAFVHSRDAYAVMPDGLWLSAATVILFVFGHIFLTLQDFSHNKAMA